LHVFCCIRVVHQLFCLVQLTVRLPQHLDSPASPQAEKWPFGLYKWFALHSQNRWHLSAWLGNPGNKNVLNKPKALDYCRIFPLLGFWLRKSFDGACPSVSCILWIYIFIYYVHVLRVCIVVTCSAELSHASGAQQNTEGMS
jgi:hypothetical protein